MGSSTGTILPAIAKRGSESRGTSTLIVLEREGEGERKGGREGGRK